MTISQITLSDLIRDIRSETLLRMETYPLKVIQGNMTQTTADREIRHMREILLTLEDVKKTGSTAEVQSPYILPDLIVCCRRAVAYRRGAGAEGIDPILVRTRLHRMKAVCTILIEIWTAANDRLAPLQQPLFQ